MNAATHRKLLFVLGPVAALVMTPIIAREGIGALRGEACCDGGACH